MQYQSTAFGQFLKSLPRGRFERLAQYAAKAKLSLQAIARLIQPLALTCRPIGEVFFPPPIDPSNQLSLALAHA